MLVSKARVTGMMRGDLVHVELLNDRGGENTFYVAIQGLTCEPCETDEGRRARECSEAFLAKTDQVVVKYTHYFCNYMCMVGDIFVDGEPLSEALRLGGHAVEHDGLHADPRVEAYVDVRNFM